MPVTVSADQMAYANRDGKLIFSGHVQVVREGQIMSSDRLEVSLDAAQAGPAGEKSTPRRDVSRMVAEGNVVFEYGDRTARAGRAEYTPATATVVLTGTPKLSDPRMQVAGEVITIDLNTQESTVQGGSFTYTEPDQGTDTAPPAGGQ
ncbi:MAG: hypothetical protein OEW11_05345 [Nitrospirota bacterium]|nr:hypothetical protein [Nitrospirota bacterium]